MSILLFKLERKALEAFIIVQLDNQTSLILTLILPSQHILYLSRSSTQSKQTELVEISITYILQEEQRGVKYAMLSPERISSPQLTLFAIALEPGLQFKMAKRFSRLSFGVDQVADGLGLTAALDLQLGQRCWRVTPLTVVCALLTPLRMIWIHLLTSGFMGSLN